jgi:DNA repair exonuclease SbcCD ATPase subunit
MFKIKNITIKNFMSVGNVSQAISFAEDELVLVLGENLDLGGNDSRNGVGKSTILNGLSYALYGEALVKIKRDNLINKVNTKGMMVTLEFEKNGVSYKIERGRKPNIFRFMVNGQTVEEDTDEAQGDSRLTQAEIERTLEISHDMFKQIVALNTYNEPFLSLKSADQRSIIEQLLGITKLSEKAEILKTQLKEVRDAIKEEEFRIKATKEANSKIEGNIKTLQLTSSAWETSRQKTIRDLEESIRELRGLDIDGELSSHKENKTVREAKREREKLQREAASYEKEIKLYNKSLTLLEKSLSITTDAKLCPTCDQEMDDHTHQRVHDEYEAQAKEAREKIAEKQAKIDEITVLIDGIATTEEQETFYDSVEDAYNHRSTLQELENNLSREKSSFNPYLDQIETLKTTGVHEIDFTFINEMNSLKDHQEFLLNLLINKDSFIRKKIIDQNLLYLNNRLSHYLAALGLPHEVKFMSDLEVEITQYGRDFDFDNLSRGERTRLILSLSLSFRDVYESLNDKINLLFIDELIDSGLDTSGVESALAVFKAMIREQHRNVFLISHRDELIGRVTSVLKVIKEGGFTSFDSTDTNLI